MHRKRRIDATRTVAQEVWIALSGAQLCRVCGTYQVSGRTVSGVLFCDECDSRLRFPWPSGAQPWHA